MVIEWLVEIPDGGAIDRTACCGLIRVGVWAGLGLHESGGNELFEQRGIEVLGRAGRCVRPVVEFMFDGPRYFAVVRFGKIEIDLDG